jgi:hypothetical protein
MQSSATTVAAYLAEQKPEDRAIISAVRKVIRANLPTGYKEVMLYGMISYVIPLSTFPDTYNKKPLTIASLGVQKNYYVLHLMCTYGNPKLNEWFKTAYIATGKKLDMGKGCLRFKKTDDLPLPLIGQLFTKVPVKTFIEFYQKARAGRI